MNIQSGKRTNADCTITNRTTPNQKFLRLKLTHAQILCDKVTLYLQIPRAVLWSFSTFRLKRNTHADISSKKRE